MQKVEAQSQEINAFFVVNLAKYHFISALPEVEQHDGNKQNVCY